MSDLFFKTVKAVDAPLEHRATIYFLHGFMGDQKATWQSDARREETFWPYWLGQVFPHLKVVSIGYETPPVSDTLSVEDKANLLLKNLRSRKEELEKPFIFICHSMGGILAKRMLLLADEKMDAKIFVNLRSLFFFATPHRGSNIAERINHYLPGAFIRNQVLHDLALNGSYLKFLNQSYCQFIESDEVAHIHHYDFCETKPVFKLFKVVDSQSSTLLNKEVAGSYEISALGHNHISICKFEDTDAQKDNRFETIVALLDRVLVKTGALDSRTEWQFSKRTDPPDTGILHFLMCFLASALGLVSIPLAIVVGGSLNNLDPHPFFGFLIDDPSYAWGVAAFTAVVAAVITYACKSRPVAWHAGISLLISLSYVAFIKIFGGSLW